jgi:Na+-translocating ferredoxin:NAD+ oxidoreductase RnfD subunit
MIQSTDAPTASLYPRGDNSRRVFALAYFLSIICLWNFLGHAFFGFEQSLVAPFVGAGTACLFQWLLDIADAWGRKRPVRKFDNPEAMIALFAPAVISGLAVSMLLYPKSQLMPIVFGAAVAIGSKVLFRAPIGKGTQHVFNPSNLGISVTLLVFPWVGSAPPYHFTENIFGIWNWVLPAIILATGLFVHSLATGRMPLIISWLVGFALQGLVRHLIFAIPWAVTLMPMTSAAFILFTLYMIPDPATTPLRPAGQVAYGFAVAAIYSILQITHVPYGLFFSLALMSATRGAWLWGMHHIGSRAVKVESLVDPTEREVTRVS